MAASKPSTVTVSLSQLNYKLSVDVETSRSEEQAVPDKLEILLDGPLGSTASDIFYHDCNGRCGVQLMSCGAEDPPGCA